MRGRPPNKPTQGMHRKRNPSAVPLRTLTAVPLLPFSPPTPSVLRSWREGLTFGRWVSGVLAQSKGRSLGLYEEQEKSEAEQRERERRDRQLGVQRLDCFGMKIPAAPVRGWWAGRAGGRVSEGSRKVSSHCRGS